MAAPAHNALSALELADIVDQRLDEIDARYSDTVDGRPGRWRAAEQLVGELVLSHGVRARYNPPDYRRLAYGGVSCSCTSGAYNLLRAWAAKTRRLAGSF